MSNAILGTAGHIDHGKTTLIKALTGINTDRLAEEKKRGITIDLGFASMDLPSGQRVGIVDVPGHERFVKNMVAGVGGIDAVLFIIAADEGLMPQSLEHLNILRILNITRGITVITKKDLVESDWLELVVGDIREKIRGTFLESRPIIPVSPITGEGMRELSEAIDDMCSEHISKDVESPLRLPVDRIFTLPGIGTIVTGSLLCGSIEIGEEVEICPRGKKSRVRTIEVHGEISKRAEAGQRTALNLTDLKVDDIRRGDVISKSGALTAVTRTYGHFKLLEDSPLILKNRSRVRIHIGTKEVMARIILHDREKLLPGDEAIVMIAFEETTACVYEDKYVVRSYSPITTIGGGEILFVNPREVKRDKRRSLIEALSLVLEGELGELILVLLRFSGKTYMKIAEIMSYTGKSQSQIERAVSSLILRGDIIAFAVGGEKILVDEGLYEKFAKKALSIIESYHKEYPLEDGMGKEELRSRLDIESGVFEKFLNLWKDAGNIDISADFVKQKGFAVSFSQKQHGTSVRLLEIYEKGGWSPPRFEEVMAELGKDSEAAKPVLLRLIRENRIVKLNDELFMSREWVDKAAELLRQHFVQNREISVAEFRSTLGTTRKFALPLLEYMDGIKVTRRAGERRVRGSNINVKG